jgi:hypothetical protein
MIVEGFSGGKLVIVGFFIENTISFFYGIKTASCLAIYRCILIGDIFY